MNDRINFAFANILKFVIATVLVAATCLASAASARAGIESRHRTPIQLEAVVVNGDPATTQSLAAKSPATPAPGKPRARTKLHKSPPSARALTLETKEAARQVLRNDYAARRQVTSLSAGPHIAPHIMQNLRETPAAPTIEMGDRPARSLSLCGSGNHRKFADLDSKTVAALLPEFNALRPRTVCARRGVLIADYAFK